MTGKVFIARSLTKTYTSGDVEVHALRQVDLEILTGHRNSRQAEVLGGLAAGDKVVLHPSDRIKDGVAVSERESG
jgi:multidrug efflux pump subunit AcrA (membrane-fusion protein)